MSYTLYAIGEHSCAKIAGQTANDTILLPVGFRIDSIDVFNTTANAITGGLRIGTTDGGVDVLAALAVAGSVIVLAPDTAILKRLFSTSATQTLYVQAVVGWNSANINIWINGRIVP